MPKNEKSSQPSHGEGPSRHKGAHQHGWSSDVDETHQEANESAHRSFHPDEYAPKPGPGRKISKEETEEVPGNTVKSTHRPGQERAGKSGESGMHDTGPRGRSQRLSGTRDASASTGVDPQEPRSDSD
ncbi:hypothetical protein P6B95_03465 [Streptomyces atratus]|uniref:hypothetical protein n=1 Tax=Streptomyces atratus TaxID=1893 RepID=UPI001670D875|nr:hypothetical protein [Streptomyces atratus]WPW26586.1 hypothetical protein P6B95_03465 [Streptomyces atratus]GGT64744.1 hypothetical protein GCM10010207_74980 [Streptomyces atratus]